MSRYTTTTEADLAEMLETIGVSSLEELFDRQIPEGVRLRERLDLPEGKSEQDVYTHLRELAAKNT
ncbi:MAG: glycine dehydrogenase, partial [Solirubrobacterales bacterium]|nr:glycine dehydrogenase [Solirubrobacterales bacterium]